MVKMYFILGYENNEPMIMAHEGIAVSESVARWLFEFTGWKSTNSPFPQLTFTIEEEEQEEGYFYIHNRDEIWVLGESVLRD